MPPSATVTYEIELLRYEDEPSLSTIAVSERLRLRYSQSATNIFMLPSI